MVKSVPARDYVFTEHALFEMQRRRLTEQLVRSVLAEPEQELEIRPGRTVLQSKVVMEEAKTYLVRVFVDVYRDPAEIVTVYRTSNISKYWSKSQ